MHRDEPHSIDLPPGRAQCPGASAVHGSHWNPLSWALMGAGAALDWAVNHAFGILSGGALLIGMACQLFDTYLRWRNSEASRAKLRAEAHAAGKAEGQSETLQRLGLGPNGRFPNRI